MLASCSARTQVHAEEAVNRDGSAGYWLLSASVRVAAFPGKLEPDEHELLLCADSGAKPVTWDGSQW